MDFSAVYCLSLPVGILISQHVFVSTSFFYHLLFSSDRSRERHKPSSSKDSSRSERSVVINPPDTPSQESPVHNGEPLPGEPSPAADQGDEAQVLTDVRTAKGRRRVVVVVVVVV